MTRPTLNRWLQLSATELAAEIQKRHVTSKEVVAAHIEQIQKVNPRLNAMVQDRFSQALVEAEKADERIAQAESRPLPPLLGVPCTIKESLAVAGMPHTSGLVARKGIIADHDALVVARIRAAGAIVLGVSNLSELCLWHESHNRLYGRTNNPYHLGHTAGGSSGGEAAIVAVGGSPFGLGSDVGGSCRIPAFFCGVFAHKPSNGITPVAGHYPQWRNAFLPLATIGTICRRAKDLAPLLRIIADPTKIQDETQVQMHELTVVNVIDNGAMKVSKELQQVQRQAAFALQKRGARLVEATLPALQESVSIWWAAISHEDSSRPYSAMVGNGTPLKLGREFLRWTLRTSSHTLPALVLPALETFWLKFPKKHRRTVEKGRGYHQQLLEQLSKQMDINTVILFPSYTKVAPRHGAPLLTGAASIYTAIFNVIGLPVTQVPLGVGRNGLPLGIQVAGSFGQDHLTIAVALALEENFGGWVPP